MIVLTSLVERTPAAKSEDTAETTKEWRVNVLLDDTAFLILVEHVKRRTDAELSSGFVVRHPSLVASSAKSCCTRHVALVFC